MSDEADMPYQHGRYWKRWHNLAWAGLLRAGEVVVSAALCVACLVWGAWFVDFSLESALRAAGVVMAGLLALAFGSNAVRCAGFVRNAVGIIRVARRHGARW